MAKPKPYPKPKPLPMKASKLSAGTAAKIRTQSNMGGNC